MVLFQYEGRKFASSHRKYIPIRKSFHGCGLIREKLSICYIINKKGKYIISVYFTWILVIKGCDFIKR